MSQKTKVVSPRVCGFACAVMSFVLAGSSMRSVCQVLQNPPSQTVPGASSGRTSPMSPDRSEPPNPLAAGNAMRLEHLREDERHKRIVADTQRLVTLTNELKDFVDKATKDQLSLDVVRKAAEIEKLARDVKERMKS